MLGDYPVYPILLARDLPVSRAFYHDTLGLEIINENDKRIFFRCGDGTQFQLDQSTTGTADMQTQIAWRVPDLRAEMADLRARGITIQEYEPPDPKTVYGIADMGIAWAAWSIDPGDNALGLMQPKPAGVTDALPPI